MGAFENVCAEWRSRLIDILKGTGWRRPIGCHKLLVIFRKRATNYRALLRKVTDENRASYDSTPLYVTQVCLHEQQYTHVAQSRVL